MKLTKDYQNIILNHTPLLDVRAPIEFNKGAFPGAVNQPILTDEERHIIGIKYKEAGNAEATALGYEMVSGEKKEERVQGWVNFFKENPEGYLYCFRGGSRSRIAQEWLHEAGIDIPRLEGGYKAFRQCLLDILDGTYLSASPITLGGHTGSGKTKVIYQVKKAIDLEGLAHHRGSSFGNYIEPQPAQIDFENQLAYALFHHNHAGYKHLIIEDEGRNVGRCFINKELFAYFRSGSMVILSIPLDGRVENTLEEYVIDSQQRYMNHYGEADGLSQWYTYIEGSMKRVERRLGGDRLKAVLAELDHAYRAQLATGSIDAHRDWITIFLRDYYDPMYEYQMSKSTRPVAFEGDASAVIEYLNQLD